MFKTSARLGGADLSKINMVNFTPGPAVSAALGAGDIDGFVFWEPFNSNAVVKKIGTYSKLDLGDNPTKHINAALYVNAEYAEKNKATVAAVVKSLVESTDTLNADRAKFTADSRSRFWSITRGNRDRDSSRQTTTSCTSTKPRRFCVSSTKPESRKAITQRRWTVRLITAS